MMFKVEVPIWADIAIALPTLVVMAFVINVLTAIWLQPYLKSKPPKKSGVGYTTIHLSLISLGGAIFGAVMAPLYSNTPLIPLGLLGVGLLLFGMLLNAKKQPRQFIIAAKAICGASYFVGHVAVTDNNATALLLAIAAIIVMCVITICIFPLAAFPRKQ